MIFRDFHKNIKIRIFETFMSSMIGSMIFPFMAIYLSAHFGAKNAGLLLIANVFVGIGITFIGGYFSDQYGRKKIMLFAEITRFLAYMIMMICNSPWFESAFITFLMMTVNSICWGFAGPANQAMLIDVSSPEQRKSMYSITYWANNLSIAIGGVAGAFLFKDYLFELFLALSIVSFSVVILVVYYMDESYTPVPSKVKPMEHVTQLFISYRKVFQDRLFVLFVLAGVFVLSMEFQLTNYVSIRLSNDMPTQQFLHWDIDGVKMMGFLRTENTILVVILALFATKLTDRLKDRSVLVASCFVFSLGYGVISYSNNIWILFFFMIIITVGEVFRVPVEQSFMASIPSSDARSTYMALNGLKFNLARLISSLTVTLGSILPSMVMTILLTAIGLAGTIIFFMVTPRLQKRKSEISLNEAS